MKTISISHDSPQVDGTRAADLHVEVPDEFAAVIEWLVRERAYQVAKWPYDETEVEHALQGLGEDSWAWERGVLNYVGRVRLFGVTSPLGVQAYLKLISTLGAMIEHLLRGEKIAGLPTPGLTSGDLGDG